jgi:hypothetical protein
MQEQAHYSVHVYVSFLCHCEMLTTTFVMVSSTKISLCSILSQSFSFTYTYLPVLSTDLVYFTAYKYVTYKSFMSGKTVRFRNSWIGEL